MVCRFLNLKSLELLCTTFNVQYNRYSYIMCVCVCVCVCTRARAFMFETQERPVLCSAHSPWKLLCNGRYNFRKQGVIRLKLRKRLQNSGLKSMKGRDHLQQLGVEGRKIFKWILEK